MDKKWYAWGLLLILGLLIMSGCAVSQAQVVVDEPEPTPANVPDAAFARDAALAYLSEHHQPKLEDLTWTEQNLTQEGLIGGSTFQYTAGDWVIRVSFPVVNPADTIYQVTIANGTISFEWQGEVDAAGRVTELSDETTEWFDPVRARDAALAYLSERYSEQAPNLDLVWSEIPRPDGANETNTTSGYPENRCLVRPSCNTLLATGRSHSPTRSSDPTWSNTRSLWSMSPQDSAGKARSRPVER